jgi:integrase/recombinase XerD
MEEITIIEFQKLNQYVKDNEKLRASTKENLHKSFTLLFFTGCRIGELFELQNKDLISVIERGEMFIKGNSTDNFRKLVFTDNGIMAIKKLCYEYNVENEDLNAYILRAKGVGNISPNQTTYVKMLNKVIRDCLGKGYSSHAFRTGFITELLKAGINTVVIKDIIGHQNTSTTLHYVKNLQIDIKNTLLR